MRAPVLVFPRTRPSGQGRGYLDAGAAGSPAAFGAAIAQGANALGGGLTDLAAELQARNNQVEKFRYLTDYTDFETAVMVQQNELKRNAPTDVTDFPLTARESFDDLSEKFLKNVTDPELQADFMQKKAELWQRLELDSQTFQYDQQNTFFLNGIKDSATSWNNRVVVDRSLLPEAKRSLIEQINASDLDPEVRAKLAHDVGVSLEISSFINEVNAIQKKKVRSGPPPGYNEGAQTLTAKLTSMGLPPMQAAVAVGNMQTESGLRTWANNAEEGAYGLIQWRLDRWPKLQAAAATAGKDWRDPNFQLMFFVNEFKQDYPRAWHKFITATTPEEANAALKQYIVYKGGTEDERLANAKAIMAGADPKGDVNVRDDTSDLDMAALNDDPMYGRVPLEERIAATNAARVDAEREANDIARAATASVNSKLNQLFVDLYDRKADETDVLQARKEGWLSDINDIAKADTILAERNKELIGQQRIQNLLDGSSTIDFNPDDSKDREAFNAYIGKDGLAQLSQMNGEWVNRVLAPAVAKIHDLPTDTVGLLEGMSRSNDPRKALFALGVLAQLEGVDKRAYARVGDQAQRDVDFWRMHKDTMTAQDLLSGIRGGTDAMTVKETEALRKRAEEILSQNVDSVPNVETFVSEMLESDTFDQSMWSTPTLGNVATAAQGMFFDYKAAFVDAYAQTRNVDDAKVLAVKTVSKRWGLTNLGGGDDPIVMKFPPHKAGYGDIEPRIDAEIRAIPEVGDLQYQLLSDERTRQDFVKWQPGKGDPPSYMIAVNDPVRGWHTLMTPDNRVPRRWNFARALQLEKEAIREAQPKAVQEAVQQIIPPAAEGGLANMMR